MKFYVDTSVWGGYKDKEFSIWTKAFFEQARQGRFIFENEFHAVDFMRQIRGELTEIYLKDKQKYLEYLQKALDDFKLKQTNQIANKG